jgi:hypothetical protein
MRSAQSLLGIFGFHMRSSPNPPERRADKVENQFIGLGFTSPRPGTSTHRSEAGSGPLLRKGSLGEVTPDEIVRRIIRADRLIFSCRDTA